MRKIICLLAAVFALSLAPAQAQSEGKTQKAKETIARKAKKVWNDAKKSVSSTADIIKDELGISNGRDSVRMKYMPIYTKNKYEGGDMYKLIQACREDYQRRCPKCEIVSSVIPEEDWTTLNMTQGGVVVGYVQQLCCYVLGKDGEDGYIYMEYTYKRSKNVGGDYVNSDWWPRMTRMDIIPAGDFDLIK